MSCSVSSCGVFMLKVLDQDGIVILAVRFGTRDVLHLVCYVSNEGVLIPTVKSCWYVDSLLFDTDNSHVGYMYRWDCFKIWQR
jgi:hypothetical protein